MLTTVQGCFVHVHHCQAMQVCWVHWESQWSEGIQEKHACSLVTGCPCLKWFSLYSKNAHFDWLGWFTDWYMSPLLYSWFIEAKCCFFLYTWLANWWIGSNESIVRWGYILYLAPLTSVVTFQTSSHERRNAKDGANKIKWYNRKCPMLDVF